MITAKEREAILKSIGSKHVKKILNYLNENKILTSNKTPYSKTYISYIVSGERENEIIENAIFAFSHLKALEKVKQQEIRDRLVDKYKNTLSKRKNT